MSKTWVIADPHFGHWGVCRFLRADGSPLRPWDNPDDMDEALVENWNSLVNDKDRVYILGDLCINRKAIPTIGRCKGRKILVKGNHDIFKLKDYIPYFDDIVSYRLYPNHGAILSHIPVHSNQMQGRWKLNVHGHMHSNCIKDLDGNPDLRYKCVSVEHTDFKPVLFEELVNE